MVHRFVPAPFNEKVLRSAAPGGDLGSGRASSLISPNGTSGKCRGVCSLWEPRLHRFSGRIHSVLSPRKILRNAGQRKSENQLFFCTTFIFFEMPMVVPRPGASATTTLIL